MSSDVAIKTAIFAVASLSAAALVTWMLNNYNTDNKRITYIQFKKKKSRKTKEQLKTATWKHVGKVTRLTIYPVKSCAGINVDSAFTAKLGLQKDVIKDRIFMIVSDKGIMINGSICPKTVLIQPRWEGDKLTLSFPDIDNVTVNVKEVVNNNVQRTVRMIDDDAPGLDCGDDVAQWLSKVLDKSCRLVYHSDFSPRTVVKPDFPFLEANDNAYYSGTSAYMMMTEETICDASKRANMPLLPARFRPNILMEGSCAYSEDDWEYINIGDVTFRNAKPCDRCLFITVDSTTGEKDVNMQPLRTLRTYRCTENNPAPYLGYNLGLDVEGTINVGDDIYATYAT